MESTPVALKHPPFPLLEGLDPALVGETLNGLAARALAEGERLDAEGGVIYLLVSGRLGVFADAHARLALATIGPGESAGELPALEGGASAVVLTALEPTRLLEFPMPRLKALMRARPRVAVNLLEALGARLRQDRAALRAGLEHRTTFEASATVDALTGLLNRRAMNDLFERELQRAVRGGVPVSLLMIGVDHLDKVNQSVGHSVGDRTLVSLATALRHVFRPGDLMARHGGGRFAVLLAEANVEAAAEAANRLRGWIAAHPVPAARDLRLSYSVSVGVAGWTPHEDLDALIARASAALEAANAAGHNRISVAGVLPATA